MISGWKEPSSLMRCSTVTPVLPGTGRGGFAVGVINIVEKLELTVKRPMSLVDPKGMHKKGIPNPEIRYKTNNSDFSGFSKALKVVVAKSLDWVYSIAENLLQFALQTYIYEKNNLAWQKHTNWV